MYGFVESQLVGSFSLPHILGGVSEVKTNGVANRLAEETRDHPGVGVPVDGFYVSGLPLS